MTNEVARYKFYPYHGEMEDHPKGTWVHIEDHERIVEELKDKIESLDAQLEREHRGSC